MKKIPLKLVQNELIQISNKYIQKLFNKGDNIGNKNSKSQSESQFYVDNTNTKVTVTSDPSRSSYDGGYYSYNDGCDADTSKITSNTDISKIKVSNTEPLKLDGEHIDSKTY